MPVTDWKFATSGTNDTSAGGTQDNWVNPGNITADDNSTASITTRPGYDSTDESEYLRAEGFGFTSSDIPDGVTLTGFELAIGRYSTASGANSYTKDEMVRVIRDGVVTGATRGDTGLFWPTSETEKTYGGAADLWSLTWTVAQARAVGAVLQVERYRNPLPDPDAHVDYMRARWHYAAAIEAIPAGAVVEVQPGTVGSVKTYRITGAAIAATPGTVTSAKAASVAGVAVSLAAGGVVSRKTYQLSGAALALVSGQPRSAKQATVSGPGVALTPGTVTSVKTYRLSGAAIAVTPGTVTASTANVKPTGHAVVVTPGTVTSVKTYRLSGAAIAVTPGTVTRSSGVHPTGAAIAVTAGTVTSSKRAYVAAGVVSLAAGALSVRKRYQLAGAALTLVSGQPRSAKRVQLAGAAVTLNAGEIGVTVPGVARPRGAALLLAAGRVTVISGLRRGLIVSEREPTNGPRDEIVEPRTPRG